MIPLKDNIPSRTTPFVTYAMIGACGLVFFLQLSTANNPDVQLVDRFGMIPQRVLHPDEPVVMVQEGMFRGRLVRFQRTLDPPPISPWLTLLTCTFLHGGWLHFLGNVWMLYIFGDNVEDRIGHFGYLLFYLGSGVAASLAHLIANPTSSIPTIGASGAIAGVMGAYFLFYPRAKVVSILPIFFLIEIVVLPAPVYLGLWFALQFFQGTLSMAADATGVAWWAHIGGFAVGFAVAALLRAVGETRPPVHQVRPHTEHVGMHRYHRGEYF